MGRKPSIALPEQRRIHQMRNEGRMWSEIAVLIGRTVDQCRHAYRRSNVAMQTAGLSWQEYYNLKIEDEGLEVDEVSDEGTGGGAVEEESRWVSKQQYVYNSDNDVYVTFIPGLVNPLAIPGDVHKAMLAAYSNWDGSPATINEICREFGMPRQWFQQYKRIHEWTHDKEPFVREDVLERDVDDMVEDALQQRRMSLYQKYERKKWLDTKNAADNWYNFEYSILVPLTTAIESSAPKYEVKKVEYGRSDKKTTAAAVSLFCDLHYGKHSWSEEVGTSYNREIAKERVFDAAEKIIDMIGRVDTIIMPIGSDDVHVDGFDGKTTKGTAQDVDGTPAQIVIEYSELVVKVADMFRQVADRVVIPVVHGNHNRHTAVMQGIIVDAWFRQCDDVEVVSKANPRSYIKYGKNLIGLTHGDSEKQTNLPGLMAKEQPQMWADTTHRTWITNHLHQEKLSNMIGVRICTTPALSGEDRWHHRKGYVGNPESAVYLFDKERGFSGTMLIAPNC